jgi:O-antigen biosynthesis protein WbqP
VVSNMPRHSRWPSRDSRLSANPGVGKIYRRVGKRLVDIAGAVVALIVAAPVMAVAAIAIRLHDGGPALFRQQRIGRNGRPFTLLKFRSMPVGTPAVPSAEARLLPFTPVGSLIRRTNIDELPQLLNVLAGEMSLVGPRPALAAQYELLALRAANGAMDCRPGLTGQAQVTAYDGMPVHEKAKLDGEYAAGISPLADARIVLRTVGYLTRRPPVY